MSTYSFTGNKVSFTYQRLLQISDGGDGNPTGIIYDGYGATVTIADENINNLYTTVNNLINNGIAGSTGSTGPQGWQGPIGLTGESVTGAQGSYGPTGFQGNTGPQGFQGPIGLTGVGATGFQGNTGPQGVQGVTGFQGNTGPGFTTIYNYAPTRILTASGSNSANAESNLTFNGQTLQVGGTLSINSNSIQNIGYVDFLTQSVVAAPNRLFYDPQEEALAYYSGNVLNSPIHIGKELFLRAYNISGVTITKGQCVHINGATSGIPTIVLSLSNPDLNATVNGVASEDILNGQIGNITTNGIVYGVDTTSLVLTNVNPGDALYLSDTIPGKFTSNYYGLSYSSRANVVGYIVATGSNGSIYVTVNNENLNLSITDRQRNILEGNVISGGIFYFQTPGFATSSTTSINVSSMKGWIVDNAGPTSSTRPTVKLIEYPGGTGITLSNITTATETYFLVDSNGLLTQQTTFPTPRERREKIYLGKVGHANKSTIANVFPEPDIDISPATQLRDMFTPIKLINNGVYPSYIGATLSFQTSAGTLWGLGIGYMTDVLNPSSISVSGQSPVTFQYRTKTGGTYSNTTVIDPGYWDNGGVRTAIGTPTKQATNQRIFLIQNGIFRVQYGQTVYSDLTTAIASVQNEVFDTFSNFRDNGILIGILSVVSNATNLSDPLQAKFLLVSKFGETIGAAGGVSTTTLQQAYNNSGEPEIITNSTNDGVVFRRGSTSDTDNVLIVQNGSASNTFYVRGDGNTWMSNLHLNNIGLTSGASKYMVVNDSGDVFYQTTIVGGGGGTGAQGPAGPTGAGGALGYWGSFWDTTTQTNAGATAANVMSLNSSDPSSNGVIVNSNTQVTVLNSGVYNIQFSAVFSKSNSSAQNYDIWIAKNGVNIPETNTRQTLAGSFELVAAWNFMLPLNASDYIELYWSSSDTTMKILSTTGSTLPDRPAIPSVILTVQQVMYTQVGPTGHQGFSGPQGFQGLQGETGTQGLQGITGPQGIIGPTGTSFTYYVHVPPAPSSPIQGDRWYDLSTGVEYVYISDIDSSQWVTPVISSGPQGPAGSGGGGTSSGAQGFQGSQGNQGTQGNQGVQGITGPQGLTGPQGAQGPQGNQGAQGPQGNQGITGPQGFTGPQGNQGVQGITGPQGFSGPQGFQGPTGPSSITIGTTPIVGGTAGYVIFQGSDNTTQQNSQFYWDNVSNRLGIGTLSPSSIVEIQNTSTASGLIVSGSSSTNMIRVTQTGNGNAISVEDDTNPDSTPFVVDSTGRVGIGLTGPTYNLDVSGRQRISGVGSTYSLEITSTGNSFIAMYGNGVSSGNGYFRITNATSTAGVFAATFWSRSNVTTYPSAWYLADLLSSVDSGTVAAMRFEARFDANQLITVRPLFEWRNSTTTNMLMFADGSLTLQNGGTFTGVTSSILSLNSTTKGFLPPRMLTSERTAITSPVAGLLTFDTNLSLYSFYNGTTWSSINTVNNGTTNQIAYYSGTSSISSTSSITFGTNMININSPITVTYSSGGALITLTGNNANGGWINMTNFGGSAPPTFTTRSIGSKFVLYETIGTASAGYAFGVAPSTLWYGVDTQLSSHKWYAGTTLISTLDGYGNYSITGTLSVGSNATIAGSLSTGTVSVLGNISATGSVRVTNTLTTGTVSVLGNISATGSATVTGTLTTGTLSVINQASATTFNAATYQIATFKALDGPAFSAYGSVATTLNNNVVTKITLDTEEFDTDNAFSTSTYRFAPTLAGYYLFQGHISVVTYASNAGSQIMSLYKNGYEYKRGVRVPCNTNGVGTMISAMIFMDGITDYIEMYGLQGSGGNVTTETGQQFGPYLQGNFVKPPIYSYVSVQYLVIGGGGGGGCNWGGGGGGGAFVEGTSGFARGFVYDVIIGTGGAGATTTGAGENGGTSYIQGVKYTPATFTITASGGGGGGYNSSGSTAVVGNSNGNGSGGGAGFPGSGGTVAGGSGVNNVTIEFQTINSYNSGGQSRGLSTFGCGGGGGAGAVGTEGQTSQAGGNGGAGKISTITGASVYYSAGGGGGGGNGSVQSSGGTGNTGGKGGNTTGGAGTNGAGGYGMGGGGGATNGGQGGNGSNGVVILRVLTSQNSNVIGTYTTSIDGLYTIFTITGDSQFIP